MAMYTPSSKVAYLSTKMKNECCIQVSTELLKKILSIVDHELLVLYSYCKKEGESIRPQTLNNYEMN